jgi:hypothetical protein
MDGLLPHRLSEPGGQGRHGLRGESGRGCVEMRQVGRFPPVARTPCGIECAALGVKSMADFVSDDGSDCASFGERRVTTEERGGIPLRAYCIVRRTDD